MFCLLVFPADILFTPLLAAGCGRGLGGLLTLDPLDLDLPRSSENVITRPEVAVIFVVKSNHFCGECMSIVTIVVGVYVN